MKICFSTNSSRTALTSLALLGTFFLSQATQAQEPIAGIISYQGQLSNNAGRPVADGTQSLTFKIYEEGAQVSSQTMSVATVGGVFNTFLSVGALSFDPTKSYELGITYNGVETKHPIAAVPVALNAKNSDTATTVQAPLTLSSNTSSATLMVNNTGTGPAVSTDGEIQATGVINTEKSYNINGQTAFSKTPGGQNSFAIGTDAGKINTGDSNFFGGVNAGRANTTGGANTFIGASAGLSNTTGGTNTFIGQLAGYFHSTGDNNIAIGSQAGIYPNGGSNNIIIGNAGALNDADTIRLGAVQSKTFIAGIFNQAVAGDPVVVDQNGQLGTVNASSRRYKQDIHPMGHESDWLLKLRPVTFRYTPQFLHSKEPSRVQHGLIAEEVAKVAPQMVQFGAQGQPEGVKYGDLPVMLLNVVQQQQQTIEALQVRLDKLEGAKKAK